MYIYVNNYDKFQQNLKWRDWGNCGDIESKPEKLEIYILIFIYLILCVDQIKIISF